MRSSVSWNAALAFAVSSIFITGCASGLGAIADTARQVVPGASASSEPRLDPRFQYIRVTVDGRPAYLALGNEERQGAGVVRVWYSAKKEVLKIQNGRLAGTAGLTTEWRAVDLSQAPSWADVKARGVEKWTRLRDVAPGYRYGVVDQLTTRLIETPRRSEVRGIEPGILTWFEERMTSTTPDLALPPARYAVNFSGSGEVVYGEQCVSRELCFTWQKWDAKQPQMNTDKHR